MCCLTEPALPVVCVFIWAQLLFLCFQHKLWRHQNHQTQELSLPTDHQSDEQFSESCGVNNPLTSKKYNYFHDRLYYILKRTILTCAYHHALSLSKEIMHTGYTVQTCIHHACAVYLFTSISFALFVLFTGHRNTWLYWLVILYYSYPYLYTHTYFQALYIIVLSILYLICCLLFVD